MAPGGGVDHKVPQLVDLGTHRLGDTQNALQLLKKEHLQKIDL